MTRTLLDTRRVALDLHALLRDIDPARWRDDRELGVRARLEVLVAELDALVAAPWPDSLSRRGPSAVQMRLEELHRLLREAVPASDAPFATRREAWLILGVRLQPAYEAFAAALRQGSVPVPSLRPTNYVRNAFHLACGLGVLWLVEDVLTTPAQRVCAAAAGAAWAWSMEIGRRASPRINHILMRIFGPVAHPHEAHRVNSATWYACALLVLAIAFDPAVAVAAIAVLAVGDPAAAIVGRRWGRHKLVHGRSLEGTVAFTLTGAWAAWIVLRTWHPEVPQAGSVAFGASVAGAIAELVSRRVDDNLAIPLAAAAGAAVTWGWWS